MEERPVNICSGVTRLLELRAQTATTLAIIGLFAAFPLLPQKWVFVIAAAIAALTLAGWPFRSRVVQPLGVFCFVCITAALARLPSQLWLLLGLVAYVAVLRFGFGQSKPGWLCAGTMSRKTWWWIAAAILASAIALITWFLVFRPDISDLSAGFVPAWPLPVLVVAGLAFSMLNAAVEEVAYRGVLTEALDNTTGAKPALFGQAVAFGLLHIHGFPRGWVGVTLAFVFGLLMGLVRRQSGGLLAPWIAHVCTDIVIVALVMGYANA